MSELGSPRTPNYILTEDFRLQMGMFDTKEIPEGTFVRPIKLEYVPKHVTEKYKYFDKTHEIYVYSRYGIFPVPKALIREV